jgi:hydroxymethylpyrimidine/phosphomethylpyrimidine kinase
MKGRVLIVAGSDSGGGAGIQGDLKAVTCLGAFGATAITALTVQNTLGVTGIVEVPPEAVAAQIAAVLDDIGADCIKTGMLHATPVVVAVADALARHGASIPLVMDPVMVAKGGAALLKPDTVSVLVERMLPRATVLTPNAPEAAALAGRPVESFEDLRAVAHALRARGPRAVLAKGGHVPGPIVRDVLVDESGEHVFESPRIDTVHTHGTGCTLASAIAAGLAQGLSILDAVARARAYVHEAIRTAPRLGRGHGPLNHAHTVRDFTS